MFSYLILNTFSYRKLKQGARILKASASSRGKNISDIGAFDITFVINRTIYDHMASYGKYTHTHPLPADKSDVGHDIGMTCCGGKYSPLRISQLHHVEQITTIKYAESDWFKRSLLTRVTWHNWNPESPSIVESDRICLVAFSVEINRNFES